MRVVSSHQWTHSIPTRCQNLQNLCQCKENHLCHSELIERDDDKKQGKMRWKMQSRKSENPAEQQQDRLGNLGGSHHQVSHHYCFIFCMITVSSFLFVVCLSSSSWIIYILSFLFLRISLVVFILSFFLSVSSCYPLWIVFVLSSCQSLPSCCSSFASHCYSFCCYSLASSHSSYPLARNPYINRSPGYNSFLCSRRCGYRGGMYSHQNEVPQEFGK